MYVYKTKCESRGCGMLIVLVRTKAGKLMPCDWPAVWYLPDPRGAERVLTFGGELVKGRVVDKPWPEAMRGYRPHWGSCKNPFDSGTKRARRNMEALAAKSGVKQAEARRAEAAAAPGPVQPVKAPKPFVAEGYEPDGVEQMCLFPAPRVRLKELYI